MVFKEGSEKLGIRGENLNRREIKSERDKEGREVKKTMRRNRNSRC